MRRPLIIGEVRILLLLLRSFSLFLGGLILPAAVVAATLSADPSNYRQLIGQLQPGDTLRLAPGSYPRLSVADLNGSADAWITIEGPADQTARITSEPCCNTVQIRRCSYLAIRNLLVDSGGVSGLDGINAKDGSSHHVLIENNRIIGAGGNQQTVGISTKSPAWGWTIRGNVILEAGTGIYLGNSDGSAPFIGGVVEGNLILYPEGYAMQIKHQVAYTIDAVGPGPQATLIRHNVFAKDNRPSGSGDRPILLVDPFPDSGQGSADRYEIYGNFLFNNPRESLIQASGRVAIHDNLLVNPAGTTAIYLTDHNGALRVADVYNNTIVGIGTGVYLASTARESHLIAANAIFAAVPVGGQASNVVSNITGTRDDAFSYLQNPVFTVDGLNLYPRDDALSGSTVEWPAGIREQSDYDRDFNGDSKGDFTWRGAYAGSGTNPGWPVALERKPLPGRDASVPEPPRLEN